MATISEAVRKAIESSGLSRYAIWKEAGIPQSTLSRFLSGDGGLNLDTLDKLAEVLGLEIRPSPRTRRIRRDKRNPAKRPRR